MEYILPLLLGLPSIIGALMANIYSYTITDLLKKNGFKASYISNSFEELGNFTHLINQTTDPIKKAEYKKIMFRLRISIATMTLGVIPLVLWMIFIY